MFDYIDIDVAYLLGLIIGRGEFSEEGEIKRLLIHFPFELMHVKGPPESELEFDQETQIRLCLDDVRRRINELLEVNVDIERYPNEITLKAVFTKTTMAWRNLRMLCNYKNSYYEFELPQVIYNVSQDLQKEFIRGLADSSASPSYADRDQAGFQRIVIQFNNQNWKLPIQVCKLLQENLNVNVQHILFGHPNIRTSGQITSHWAKEHRLRIYADDFASIGFNFPYKQRILEEMIKYNKTNKKFETKKCNPKIKRIRTKKPHHPGENDSKLPSEVRRHFDAAFEICLELGCDQGEAGLQLELVPIEEENV
jgi:hypothetical protein